MQKLADVGHGAGKVPGLRQHDDPEVIRLRPVEAAARHQQDMLLVQKVHGEFFIVGDGTLFEIDAGEDIEGGGIFDDRKAIELPQGIDRRFPLLVQSAAGQKQLLTIARAMLQNAPMLILDEATSGLDPVVRDEMLDLFLEFIQDEGHSIFVSSHILSDLEKVCDYITLIHGGRIVFSEEKDALLEKYVVAKVSEAELRSLDPAKVAGVRRSAFGAEALVERGAARGLVCDPAGIEDIMLYYLRGERK